MSSFRPKDVKTLRLAAFGLITLSGCAPKLVTNTIQLTPANEIALQDGTPIVRLTGYQGNPRATISFVFPSGETLAGDAIMNADVKNTMTLWGQLPHTASSNATIAMVATGQYQTMACTGTFIPNATDLTCRFSDGAIYNNIYTAPLPAKPAPARKVGCLGTPPPSP